MKIGILGGSFNPPHQGHIHISKLALKKLNLNQLWWIPTKQNPLKNKNNFLTFKEKLQKCQLVTHNNFKIKVKNIHYFYSIDLVKILKKRHKNHQFFWIMGDDNLHEFHRWHRFSDLLCEVEFAIFSRENSALKSRNSKAIKIYQNIKNTNQLPKIRFFNNPKINISSTQIRHEK